MKRPAIICDIDGTVADITHRLHYIKGPIELGDFVRPVGVPNAKLQKYKYIEQVIGYGLDIAYDVLVAVTEHCDAPLITTRNLQDNSLYRKVKSYSKFYGAVSQDKPIDITIILVTELANALGIPIIFCSGRPDSCAADTYDWLQANVIKPHGVVETELFMRKTGDTRKDCIVKREIYEEYIEPRYDIVAVFDDRQQVVDMWRDLGLQCYQVAKGDF